MMKKKPTTKSAQGSEEFRQVNDHQIRIYFSRYDRFWRLHKLIALRHLLSSREEIREILRDRYDDPKLDDSQIVYGNVTNGILADATSELAMLCEDYFSLLRYIREPTLFVKKAISYSAGTVTTLSKALRNPTDDGLRILFFVPPLNVLMAAFAETSLATAHTSLAAFQEQIESLRRLHQAAIVFYDKHKDFHVQYKHGLKLALSGLHGSIPQDEVDRRRREFSAPLFAFENKPTADLGYGSAMMIPDIKLDALRKNMGSLHSNLNLLHIQFIHNVDIDECIDLATKLVQMINFLISNRLALIDNDGSRRVRFLMPMSNEGSRKMQCQCYEFDVPGGYKVPTIFDYQLG